MAFRALWPLLAFMATAACAVQFFVSTEFDTCSYDGISMPCQNNTIRGGLCGYAADAGRLWCCPAGQSICWSWEQLCSINATDLSPAGPGQISCNNLDYTWCCNKEYELCTENTDQVNVCVSKFSNPNADVAISAANAEESSSLAALSPGTRNTPQTTKTTPSTSSSVPVTLASVSGVASSSSSSSGLPSSAASSALSTSSKSSSLSGGAIAGIVIGAIALLAIVGTALYCLGRRHSKKGREERSTMAPGPTKLEDPFTPDPSPGIYGGEAKLVGSNIPELQGQPRHEL